jgi:hypothetical protein
MIHNVNSYRLCLLSLLMMLFVLSGCVFSDTFGFRDKYGEEFYNNSITYVKQTSDGGYIAFLYGSPCSEFICSWYTSVFKIDKNGKFLWSKLLSSNSGYSVLSVDQTSDGNYILGAYSGVYKYDPDFNLVWSRAVPDTATAIYSYLKNNNEYVLVSVGGESSSTKIILIGFDQDGNILWETQSDLGQKFDLSPSSPITSYKPVICKTNNNGIILGLYHNSNVILLRTDSYGNVLMEKEIIFTGPMQMSGVCQTADNGFAVTGCIKPAGSEYYKALNLRTDNDGNVISENDFGGNDNDLYGYLIQETSDGGYTIVGNTSPLKAIIIKVDTNGKEIWRRYSFNMGAAFSLQQTRDGGYIIGGSAYLLKVTEGNLYINKIRGWLSKTDPNGIMLPVISSNNPLMFTLP